MAVTEKKRHGATTDFAYSDVPPAAEVYTLLSNIAMVDPPETETAVPDGTDLDSTERHKEYIAEQGWKDTTELVVEAYFKETPYETLEGFFQASTEKYWRIRLPLTTGQATRTQLRIRGVIKKLKIVNMDKSKDDPIMATFSIKRTIGKIDYTKGTAA